MQVDQQNEEVYVLDSHDAVWKIGDWKKPRIVKLPLKTASIAIDSSEQAGRRSGQERENHPADRGRTPGRHRSQRAHRGALRHHPLR